MTSRALGQAYVAHRNKVLMSLGYTLLSNEEDIIYASYDEEVRLMCRKILAHLMLENYELIL